MVRPVPREQISLTEDQRRALDRGLNAPGVYDQIRILVSSELMSIENDLNRAARSALVSADARVTALRLEGRLEQMKRITELLDRDWITNG